MTRALKTIWPFWLACATVLMLVTFVPALSLWLPAMMKETGSRSVPARRRPIGSCRWTDGGRTGYLHATTHAGPTAGATS